MPESSPAAAAAAARERMPVAEASSRGSSSRSSSSSSSSSGSGSGSGSAGGNARGSGRGVRQPRPQPPYTPLRLGSLKGPGAVTRVWCVALSAVDEHLWRAGAPPAGGEGVLDQVRRGPCSWSMLLSCTFCFQVPAAVHLALCEGWPDVLAAWALAAVSVTSPLCDALCVHSAVYERGPGYEWTAAAVGLDAETVKCQIQQEHAGSAVFCVDHWNILTRLVDRATCVFLVGPSMLCYAWWRRPSLALLAPFLGGFLVAWAAAARGQLLRAEFPSGVLYVSGAWRFEESFRAYMWWHQLWHWLLFGLLLASSLYRPAM